MGESKCKLKKRGSINLFLLFLLITFPIAQNFSQELKLENPFRFYSNSVLDKNTLESHQIDFLKLPGKIFNLNKKTTEENPMLIDSIISQSVSDSKIKFTFTYNDSGKIESFLESLSINGPWENGERVSNVYDSVGNVVSILYEFWNGSAWYNDINENFTYDSLGNNISHLIQYWIEDRWEDYTKIYNTYDISGNLTLTIRKIWSDSLWVNSSKTTNSYSPYGLRDSSFLYIWGDGHWGSYVLQTYRYNENKDLASVLTRMWDRNKWENYAYVKLTYEIEEPQITGGIALWNSNNWINYGRYLYTFNEDDYFTYGEYESWENESWIPDDGPINISNPDGFELHFLTHEASVYYNTPTDVVQDDDLSPDKFILLQNYPNPFNPTTIIKYTIAPPNLPQGEASVGTSFMKFVTLIVYDVLGNEVATLVDKEQPAGSYEVEFDASKLASGIYIYRLQAGKFIQSKKMILLK